MKQKENDKKNKTQSGRANLQITRFTSKKTLFRRQTLKYARNLLLPVCCHYISLTLGGLLEAKGIRGSRYLMTAVKGTVAVLLRF